MASKPRIRGVNVRKPNYEVVVGNVGNVYTGTKRREAIKIYNGYVAYSEGVDGARCYGENVTLMRDGELLKEHDGHLNYIALTVTAVVPRDEVDQVEEDIAEALGNGDYFVSFSTTKRPATPYEVRKHNDVT